jgi:hypothetical protein
MKNPKWNHDVQNEDLMGKMGYGKRYAQNMMICKLKHTYLCWCLLEWHRCSWLRIGRLSEWCWVQYGEAEDLVQKEVILFALPSSLCPTTLLCLLLWKSASTSWWGRGYPDIHKKFLLWMGHWPWHIPWSSFLFMNTIMVFIHSSASAYKSFSPNIIETWEPQLIKNIVISAVELHSILWCLGSF